MRQMLLYYRKDCWKLYLEIIRKEHRGNIVLHVQHTDMQFDHYFVELQFILFIANLALNISISSITYLN